MGAGAGMEDLRPCRPEADLGLATEEGNLGSSGMMKVSPFSDSECREMIGVIGGVLSWPLVWLDSEAESNSSGHGDLATSCSLAVKALLRPTLEYRGMRVDLFKSPPSEDEPADADREGLLNGEGCKRSCLAWERGSLSSSIDEA
jgi:hypothetical protein